MIQQLSLFDQPDDENDDHHVCHFFIFATKQFAHFEEYADGLKWLKKNKVNLMSSDGTGAFGPKNGNLGKNI